MECMEARALKSSFLEEKALKLNYPQIISDDFWCVKNFTTTTVDDFSVDEFFDIPNEDFNKNSSFLEDDEEDDDDDEDKYSSKRCFDDIQTNSLHFSPDLAIPVDDMQELELWSHLMDDTVPEPSLLCPNPVVGVQCKKTGFNSMNRFEPGSGKVSFVASAVPVKPRSKRARTVGSRTWFTGSSSKTESPSSSSASSSPTSALFFSNPVQDMGMVFTFGKPAMKKPKKNPVLVTAIKEVSGPMFQRRCTHCQVTKTPQWRAGPNGPKTLCNACGVRFKSGRLFPEYRPACSPTFSSEIHSNSHRKVVEMRRKKETTGSATGSTFTVYSN